MQYLPVGLLKDAQITQLIIQLFVYYLLRCVAFELTVFSDITAEAEVHTVSKVWNTAFANVGCCMLTFVNNTKAIYNFIGIYSLSVKKM